MLPPPPNSRSAVIRIRNLKWRCRIRSLTLIFSFAFAFRTREANATLLFQSSKLTTRRTRQSGSHEVRARALAFNFAGLPRLLPLPRLSGAALRTGCRAPREGRQHPLGNRLQRRPAALGLYDARRQEVCGIEFVVDRNYSIRLRVDDREIASGTLNDEETVGSTSQRLFLGGFPVTVGNLEFTDRNI